MPFKTYCSFIVSVVNVRLSILPSDQTDEPTDEQTDGLLVIPTTLPVPTTIDRPKTNMPYPPNLCLPLNTSHAPFATSIKTSQQSSATATPPAHMYIYIYMRLALLHARYNMIQVQASITTFTCRKRIELGGIFCDSHRFLRWSRTIT